MFNPIRRLFQRDSEKAAMPPMSRGEAPLAIYLSPDGRQVPISLKTGGLALSNDLPAFYAQVNRTLDGSDAELPMNEEGYARAAASCVWAYNCIDLRAQKVAEIIRKAGRVVNIADGKVIEDHPMMRGISRAWSAYRQDLWYEWEHNLCTFGENYTELVNAYVYNIGFASTVRTINPLQIEPYIERGKVAYFDFIDDTYERMYFSPDEISFDKTKNSENDYRGLSPMRLAMSAVNIDMHIQRVTSSHYKNGLRPGIIFSIKKEYFDGGKTLSEKDWTTFIERIRTQAKGTRNAYRPLALDMPVDVTVIQPPKLEEQGAISDSEKERIAAAWRIPAPLVTFGDQKYQLSPEQRDYLYEEVLVPRCEHITMVANTDILPFFDHSGKTRFELDRKQIDALTEDQNAKAASLRDQFEGGQITFNQMQQGLNLPTQIGGDFYLFKTGFVPVQVSALSSMSAGTLNPQPPAPMTGAPAMQAVEMDVHDHAPQEPFGDVGNVVQAKHKLPEDELAAWSKCYKQSGANKALKFFSHLLRDEVQAPLRDAITNGDTTAVKAAFEAARIQLSAKSIDATKTEFEGAFNNILESARDEDYRRNQAQRQMYRTVQKFGEQAFINGLSEGGVDVESATDIDRDDRRTINRLQSEAAGFISNLLARVYGVGISDGVAELKAQQWFARTILPFFDAGRLSANQNMMVEFVGDDGAKTCVSCASLKGQRHRLVEWVDRGLNPPYGPNLDCADGGQCKHTLVRVSGRARGRWV